MSKIGLSFEIFLLEFSEKQPKKKPEITLKTSEAEIVIVRISLVNTTKQLTSHYVLKFQSWTLFINFESI